jgi:hypothetical protein
MAAAAIGLAGTLANASANTPRLTQRDAPGLASERRATNEIAWGGAYGGGLWLLRDGRKSRLTSSDETADGIVLDGQHMWWVENGGTDDIYEGTIARRGSRFTLVNVRSIVHLATPGRLDALALGPGYVYWLAIPPGASDVSPDAIGRAKRDGSAIDPSFITRGTNQETAALAVSGGYLYWAGGGTIGRARLDGSDQRPNFVTGVFQTNPTSLLVHGRYIYWAGFDGIGRADTNGHSQRQLLRQIGEADGLATDGRYLYWGTYGNGKSRSTPIGRSLLDGTHVNRFFVSRPGVDGVMRVAAEG